MTSLAREGRLVVAAAGLAGLLLVGCGSGSGGAGSGSAAPVITGDSTETASTTVVSSGDVSSTVASSTHPMENRLAQWTLRSMDRWSQSLRTSAT